MAEDWGRRAAAEFVGTFTLVFIGVGSIVSGVVRWLWPSIAGKNAATIGAPTLHFVSPFEGAVIEAILTFFLSGSTCVRSRRCRSGPRRRASSSGPATRPPVSTAAPRPRT